MQESVLVVDDEAHVADRLADDLRPEYEVVTAYGGTEALELLDETVDVVLLDRRMPDVDGEVVLETIRERGLDCRVAMVTGVEPDFDVLEMGFDDYLVKPVTTRELRRTVATLVTRTELETQLQEYLSLVSKQVVLRTEKSDDELAASREFHELTARIDRLEEELSELLADLSYEDAFAAATGGAPRHDEGFT